MSQRKISGILLVCLLVFGLPAMAQDEDEDVPVTALGPTLQEYPYAPAVSVLSDTLHTVADGQQLLLGFEERSGGRLKLFQGSPYRCLGFLQNLTGDFLLGGG